MARDQERAQAQEVSALKIHRALLREAEEPAEAGHTGPWWLWAAVVLTVFTGGFYFGNHYGKFGVTPHLGYLTPGAGAHKEAVPQQVSGATVFTTHCASCHQANGQGVPGTFPPLVGSEWVQGDPETVVRILLNGLQGSISVRGATFNGAMPAWKDQLNDAEIAAVATHVRSMGGNKGGPVDVELVKRLRQELDTRSTPWTAAELQALRRGA
ncbi:cytochrome c [Thermithiobacillus plumbiphilus]|uniref:Cytochrome c n=1 Tax=Thermithiobacillus plumbiphilus TaxID=1729899 RepID=A0ABU9DAI9_9PROT